MLPGPAELALPSTELGSLRHPASTLFMCVSRKNSCCLRTARRARCLAHYWLRLCSRVTTCCACRMLQAALDCHGSARHSQALAIDVSARYTRGRVEAIVACHGMPWQGMAWYDMAWHDMDRMDSVRAASACARLRMRTPAIYMQDKAGQGRAMPPRFPSRTHTHRALPQHSSRAAALAYRNLSRPGQPTPRTAGASIDSGTRRSCTLFPGSESVGQ